MFLVFANKQLGLAKHSAAKPATTEVFVLASTCPHFSAFARSLRVTGRFAKLASFDQFKLKLIFASHSSNTDQSGRSFTSCRAHFLCE